MARYIRRNRSHPINSCVTHKTQPEELVYGPACEREKIGLDPKDLSALVPSDGYGDCNDGYDGYDSVRHSSEGDYPEELIPFDTSRCQGERTGYRRYTPSEWFNGTGIDGRCISPYSRLAFKDGVYKAMVDREEQILRTTGKPVQLLRRQHTGTQCPCYSLNRGRSRKDCEICFGTNYVPGYIPYIYDKDPLGRIYVRFEPYTEDLQQKAEGRFQEITINCWTLPAPLLRQRDILIVYTEDGLEEFRYEVMNVTRNDTLAGMQGAQRFTIKRLDPNLPVYKFDPFAVPDLADIEIDVSAAKESPDEELADRFYDRLGNVNDGEFADTYNEARYGDAAFSHQFTEGYKEAYQVNFIRALENYQPLLVPDFNEDGAIDNGYGPIYTAVDGRMIKFSTPQQVEINTGINPFEVLDAEQSRLFLKGWREGAIHGFQDGINQARARGTLT